MSLRPGLLASTSRLTLGYRTTSAPIQWHRAASTDAASKPARKIDGTVQAADEEIKKREAQMRRLPPGMDMTAAFATQLMDPHVEPPFQPSWLMKSGFFAWTWGMGRQRWATTVQAIRAMRQAGYFKRTENPLYKLATVWSYRSRAAPLVDELTQLYESYNIAQARGDQAALRKLATSKALARAKQTASTIGNPSNQWQITQQNAKPCLLSARHQAFLPNSKTESSQVIIRFDTNQTLTRKNKPPQTMRVVENICFHRENKPGDLWMIRDRVELTQPFFIKAQE